MFPTGYFFSSGLCLQRCFQLVISSLLGLVSRDVSNWLFRLFWRLPRSYWNFKRFSQSYWNSKDQIPKCSVLSLCTTVFLVDFVSRDVSNWLFRLFWTLFPEMFPTGYFVSSGDYHDLTGTQKITTILLELKRSNPNVLCSPCAPQSLL